MRQQRTDVRCEYWVGKLLFDILQVKLAVDRVPVPALVYLLDLGKNRVETVHHGLCIDFRGGYP